MQNNTNEKRLTAHEARDLMTNSHWLEKNIYKWIKDCCKRSGSRLTFEVDYNWDNDEVIYALNSLETNGYNIYKVFGDNNELIKFTVSW